MLQTIDCLKFIMIILSFVSFLKKFVQQDLHAPHFGAFFGGFSRVAGLIRIFSNFFLVDYRLLRIWYL